MAPDDTINSEVNACLRLAELAMLPAKGRDLRKVMALEIAGRSPVADFLQKLNKSSTIGAKKLLVLLRRIAESRAVPNLGTIKRVGSLGRLWQLDGHKNARLYCFEDNEFLVVCVAGFWIGRGDKLSHQDKVIRDADARMRLWECATPSPEDDFVRFTTYGGEAHDE